MPTKAWNQSDFEEVTMWNKSIVKDGRTSVFISHYQFTSEWTQLLAYGRRPEKALWGHFLKLKPRQHKNPPEVFPLKAQKALQYIFKELFTSSGHTKHWWTKLTTLMHTVPMGNHVCIYKTYFALHCWNQFPLDSMVLQVHFCKICWSLIYN